MMEPLTLLYYHTGFLISNYYQNIYAILPLSVCLSQKFWTEDKMADGTLEISKEARYTIHNWNHWLSAEGT